MKIFITGASGYIGSVVSEKLINRGHTVFGLARSEESARKLETIGATPVRGGLSDLSVIAKATAESDGVIHAAMAGGIESPILDRSAALTIIETLAGSNKPFIYTSGIWVLGNTGDSVADEDTPLDPAPLVAWRPSIEKLVLEAAQRGVRSIVIRPAVVFGRGGGLVNSFIESAKLDGAAKVIGEGNNRWPLVHVDDLAMLYVLTIENALPGTLLYAAFGPSLRMRRIAEEASRTAGAGGKIFEWPIEDARASLGPFADALALDQQISAGKAIAKFNWTPDSPSLLEELIRGSYKSATD